MTIRYRFEFSDGDSKEFLVELEKPGLRLRSRPALPLPEWTGLCYHQSPNCPLSVEQHPHYPIAVNLVDVIEAFTDVVSHEEADVEVITESRKYSAHVNMTHAVGSLIGIFMATSGCPIVGRLKPMALTHLPFPTTEESTRKSGRCSELSSTGRTTNGVPSGGRRGGFSRRRIPGRVFHAP